MPLKYLLISAPSGRLVGLNALASTARASRIAAASNNDTNRSYAPSGIGQIKDFLIGISAKTLRPILRTQVDRKSALMS